MENNKIQEKFNKKRKRFGFFSYIIKKIPLVIVTAALSSWLTYNNYTDLTELNNVKDFNIPENGVQHPYNVHIYREKKDSLVYTYLINTRTDKKLLINKDMKLGDFKYRLESLIGTEEDSESIMGKYDVTKKEMTNKANELYNEIRDFLEKKKILPSDKYEHK